MKRSYDAIIIGAGVVGLSAAYQLSSRGLDIIVIEKDFPGAGSTNRCIGGIRQQFSTAASIKLMKESVRLFQQMDETFGFSVEFHQGGYLFLGYTPEHLEAFKQSIAVQTEQDLDVRLLTANQCGEVVPQLNLQGLLGGTYSPADGQANPFNVLKGYIQAIKHNGSHLESFTEVTGIIVDNNRAVGVVTNSGHKVYAGAILNAAGPWAAPVGHLAGVQLPIAPERHEAFITERMKKFFEPMIVDFRSDGCYFNQRVNGQVIGCYSPDPPLPGTNTDATPEFAGEMSRRALRLLPSLAASRVLRQWGGSYSNTPDRSPIIDKTPLPGFYVAAGMSGHGFMFAPAAGKYIAGIIMEGAYPFEWGEFKLDREFTKEEILK